MITLSASASYGSGGKQYIARIVGRNSKMTFEREFVGSKRGKRGEHSEADLDTPGLYECRDIGRKGDKEDRYVLLIEVDVGADEPELLQFPCNKEDALKIGKAMDAGRKFPELVEAWVADPECAAMVAKVIEVDRTIIAVGGPDWIGRAVKAGAAIPDDATPEQAAAILGAHQAPIKEERARVAKQLAEMLSAGKPCKSGWDHVTVRQARTAEVAQTIDTATEACWEVLQSLAEKEGKKVLTALRQRLSPPKSAAQVGMSENTPAGVVADANAEAGVPAKQMGMDRTPVANASADPGGSH